MEDRTIKIHGYSEGDESVGIASIEFTLDTGMEELDKNERNFIKEYIIPNIEELHDNGKLKYHFSDDDSDW